MNLADRLIDLRKEENLTQVELAKKLNISRSSLSMYENGERRPSFELADAMAAFFDVDLSYLLGTTDKKRSYYGHREQEEANLEYLLQSDEFALLMAYRKASDELKGAALRVLGVR